MPNLRERDCTSFLFFQETARQQHVVMVVVVVVVVVDIVWYRVVFDLSEG